MYFKSHCVLVLYFVEIQNVSFFFFFLKSYITEKGESWKLRLISLESVADYVKIEGVAH